MPRIRAESITEHKEMTRQALLDSARHQIGVVGSVDISLGDVAGIAGVGRTTFYEYFTDRDDVVASLVEAELPLVLEEMIASVSKDLPVAERLGELALLMVEFVAADPVLGVILHKEVGRMSPDAQERIAASHVALSKEMTDLYRQGVEEGVFRALPRRLAGMLIQESIMTGARVVMSGPHDVMKVTDGVRDFLIAGLAGDSAVE